MCRLLKRGKGFTLIELLVVIVIIAILAAILFPMFSSAKQSAYRASCSSNMSQIYKGMTAYADDYGGRLPWATSQYNVFWSKAGEPPPDNLWIGQLLKKYEGNKTDIWKCPANPYKMYDPKSPGSWNLCFYYNLFYYNIKGADAKVAYATSMSGHLLTRMDWSSSWMVNSKGNAVMWDKTRLTHLPLLWDQRKYRFDATTNKYVATKDEPGLLIHTGGWNVLFGDGHVKWWTENDRSPYQPEGYD